ncbi:MAG: hypothetical protein RLZZ461_931, partial [Planctomycetota bacterium]
MLAIEVKDLVDHDHGALQHESR